MKIGIDISQIVFEGTGVASYLKNLVENLLKIDKENEYILFFSSLRKKFLIPRSGSSDCSPKARSRLSNFAFRHETCSMQAFLNKSKNPNFQIKTFKLPPTLLDFLWNRLHVCPIEWFIGKVDIFITSDWTEPPAKRAKKVTILYDLIVYKYPNETDKKIVETQKRKLEWVKKESDIIFCISEATKKDAMEILGIEERRLKVIYPGGTREA